MPLLKMKHKSAERSKRLDFIAILSFQFRFRFGFDIDIETNNFRISKLNTIKLMGNYLILKSHRHHKYLAAKLNFLGNQNFQSSQNPNIEHNMGSNNIQKTKAKREKHMQTIERKRHVQVFSFALLVRGKELNIHIMR